MHYFSCGVIPEANREGLEVRVLIPYFCLTSFYICFKLFRAEEINRFKEHSVRVGEWKERRNRKIRKIRHCSEHYVYLSFHWGQENGC